MQADSEEADKKEPRAPLSAEELRRRRKAVDFSRVNCEMEGLYADDEFNAMMERYANGEIDREDVDEYMENYLEDIHSGKIVVQRMPRDNGYMEADKEEPRAPLSPEELRHRSKAVDLALVCVEMEILFASEELNEMMECHANEEISSEELDEFMENRINSEEADKKEPRATLSAEELRRRRRAVDFSRVNCELSGLYCTDQTYIDLKEKYARGEIEAEVISAYVDKLLEENCRARQGTEVEEADKKEPRAPLSPEELARRRKSIDFARASVEMSGFSTDDEYREIEERYVKGEIDLEDLAAYSENLVEDIRSGKIVVKDLPRDNGYEDVEAHNSPWPEGIDRKELAACISKYVRGEIELEDFAARISKIEKGQSCP
jgi:uncharacterized membrane protein